MTAYQPFISSWHRLRRRAEFRRVASHRPGFALTSAYGRRVVVSGLLYLLRLSLSRRVSCTNPCTTHTHVQYAAFPEPDSCRT
jgi:hypothetical protein